MPRIQKIAILTSGGDAPGMNAAIRSIVIAASHYKIDVIGFYHGYNGLVNNESCQLVLNDVRDIIHKGGTILKSARCPAMKTKEGLTQATNTLIKEEVDALIVIGGDGSFAGLLELSACWSGQVIGLPGTIDNDVDGTDFTIGFSTAVNTAIEAIDKIRDTANAFDRVFIIELMGRHSGHITYNVGIACGVEHIISFENFVEDEINTRLDTLAHEINDQQVNKFHSYLIVVSENLWPGGSSALVAQLKEKKNIDATACILGHIQRGGNPVAKDRLLATRLGVAGIQTLLAGKTKLMIGEKNNTLAYVPLEEAIRHKKVVSPSLVNAQDNILNIID